MAADIYRLFRSFIGDSVPDYSLADFEALKFLDMGIDKASDVLNYTIVEDVTITATDISNGYVDLSYDIVTIISSELGSYVSSNTFYDGTGGEDINWETAGGKRIRFIDASNISAGIYEFRYKARYNKFDGVVRDNDYFNYPREVDLGIVFLALSQYMVTKGITDVGGEIDIATSKSEEGMSVSYGTGTAMRISSPDQLRKEAMKIFNSASNRKNINFSVTV